MKIKLIRSEKRLREFSKKVIVSMIFLWFIGALFGGWMVWRTSGELSALLDYIGMPMGAGILGYLLKSGFENREKIKKGADSYENQLGTETHQP